MPPEDPPQIKHEGTSLEPNPARNGHRVPYEPRCKVCKDPGRPELEQMYTRGDPWEDLLDWANGEYTQRDITRHMRALDFDVERTKATYRVMALMMEKGLERINQGYESVTPDHLLKLIPHIDKREGRIVEHVKIDTPRQIIINAPMGLPLPGLRELSEPVIEGKLVPEAPRELLLPPKKESSH